MQQAASPSTVVTGSQVNMHLIAVQLAGSAPLAGRQVPSTLRLTPVPPKTEVPRYTQSISFPQVLTGASNSKRQDTSCHSPHYILCTCTYIHLLLLLLLLPNAILKPIARRSRSSELVKVRRRVRIALSSESDAELLSVVEINDHCAQRSPYTVALIHSSYLYNRGGGFGGFAGLTGRLAPYFDRSRGQQGKDGSKGVD